MGIKQLAGRIGKGVSNAKGFLGRAYRGVSKFAGQLDGYASTVRKVVGAVAPVAGAMTGPMGGAVGAGIGAAMKGLSAYDALKTEAMGAASQAGRVVGAVQRGLK